MSHEDVSSRYNGCIVLYGDRPFYIEEINSDYEAWGRFLDDSYEETISIHDPAFNTHSPILGFINGPRHCHYVSRTPARYYRHGLNQRNTTSFDVTRGRYNTGHAVFTHSQSGSMGLIACIKNLYPTYEECLYILSQYGSGSQAFNKEYAIRKTQRERTIHYSGDTVIGQLGPDDKLILNEDYNYLLEELGELNVLF